LPLLRRRSVKRKVVQVKQSPLNEQRWMQVLECNHEIWVTRVRRPEAEYADCHECDTDLMNEGIRH
jgi:hypothetical protein